MHFPGIKNVLFEDRDECLSSYDIHANTPLKKMFPSQMPRSRWLSVYVLICNYASLLKRWRIIPLSCLMYVWSLFRQKYKTVLKTTFLQSSFFLHGNCPPGLILSLAQRKLPYYRLSLIIEYLLIIVSTSLWFLSLLLHLERPFSTLRVKIYFIHSSSYFICCL